MSVITPDTNAGQVLTDYPWLVEKLIKLDDRFAVLSNPLTKIAIKNMSLKDVAKKAGISADVLVNKLNEIIADN